MDTLALLPKAQTRVQRCVKQFLCSCGSSFHFILWTLRRTHTLAHLKNALLAKLTALSKATHIHADAWKRPRSMHNCSWEASVSRRVHGDILACQTVCEFMNNEQTML